jgi:hypothetical protein
MDRSKKKSYKLKPDASSTSSRSWARLPGGRELPLRRPSSTSRSCRNTTTSDSVSAWVITKMIWSELTEKQRDCALIEAACLSMVAEANYKGMPVDTL